MITSSPGPTPAASNARCRAVVQLETAQACGAPTASGELPLKGGDLRALGCPAGKDDTARGGRLWFTEKRFSDWNHRIFVRLRRLAMNSAEKFMARRFGIVSSSG